MNTMTVVRYAGGDKDRQYLVERWPDGLVTIATRTDDWDTWSPPTTLVQPTEEWREVVGSDGFYEVSNLGNVRSWKRKGPGGRRSSAPRPIRTQVGAHGYVIAGLFIDGKSVSRRVHRLVAEAFIGPRPIDMCIAHGDGNKRNNAVFNLRYATPKENAEDTLHHGTRSIGEHRYNARLTEVAVAELRRRRAAGESPTSLAREYGVSKAAVMSAISGRTWSHVGVTP